jgi:hypothetical protein
MPPRAEVDRILAMGRKLALWTWYNTDDEIHPALHVMINAFPSQLTPEQRRDAAPVWTEALVWCSVPDNFSGLNTQNLYVAGRLMQDPSLDPQQLLDEFCRGFVGEENAPALATALRAVQQSRSKSWSYTQQPADPWLDDATRAVDNALRGLQTVKLAPDFQPAWPVTMEPADYLIELQAHLEAIRQMLSFLGGVREVERMKAAGEPVEKLQAAINALPKVEYDPAHTAGLEAERASEITMALKKTMGVS